MKINLTIKLICAALFMIAMSIVYYHMAMRIEINSDMASGLLEAKDMAGGNVLLEGWSLSTVPFYFTELIWYAICIALFGFSHKLSYAFSAIYLAILFITMVSASENKKLGAILSFFLLGSPVVFLSQNLLTPVVHVGTYIFSLCAFIVMKRIINTGCRKSLVAAYVILSLLYFSDAMSMYLVFIPLIVTSGVYLLGMKIEKRWLHITVVSIVSYLTSILIWKLFTKYGFNVPGLQETKFATAQAIGKNISDFADGTLRLYGAYFFGLSPKDPVAAKSCLSFAALCFFIGLILLKVKNFFRFEGHEVYLLVSTLIMPLAFIFSDISIGIESIRYIIPFFIFGSVFISSGKIIPAFNYRIWSIIFTVVILAGALHIKETLKSPRASDKYMQISEALKAEGLKKGIATFWDASSVTVYGDAQVSPVYPDKDRIVKYNWLSKKDWYENGNRFIIINNNDMEKAAVAAFGHPDKTIFAGERNIFIWNKEVNPSD